MTTDRDLLARAAQAAGKSRAEWDYDWLVERGVDVSRDMLWNSLENSGQALELAVQLRLDIYHYPLENEPHVSAHDQRNEFGGFVENYDSNPLAATCRAITRAAAATVPA